MFNKRIREAVLILVAAISFFLLLSLISYHSTDLSLLAHAHAKKSVMNLGGCVGALLAGGLIYLVGGLAYFFPLMMIYAAWVYFRKRNQPERDYIYLTLRTMGFILIIISGCALASLRFRAGGLLGKSAALYMVKFLNAPGAILILLALFLIGITLFTGLSWLKLVDNTGKYTLQSVMILWKWIYRLKEINFRLKFKLKPKQSIQDNKRKEPLLLEPAENKDKDSQPSPPIKSAPKENLSNMDKPKISIAAKPVMHVLSQENSGTFPSLALLDLPDETKHKGYTHQQLEEMSREVELRLLDFGVEVKVVAVYPGPVVTRFELQLAAGTKVSKINALVKDLARSLSVVSARVVEVIPGKSVIGLELPNQNRQVVRLRQILSTTQYENSRSPLTLALGKDIAGHPVIVDLAKMPHLLVAGTTGSGKSVGLNAMLLSLLYKSTPEHLRLILIDPKMLELAIYEGIPHLLTPVVTDMKEAANALRWCVAEMERRYKLMASLGVRNISGYNLKVAEAVKNGKPLLDPLWQPEKSSAPHELTELPYIVVLADEFADLMMVVGKKIEELIARLAQKARAAGIHLILATQRPSVDVITGLIKANIPTRIAFQVSSKIDSRTILDQSGAEQLLGHGDMLYLAPGTGVPVRVHGAYVADEEVHRVVDDWKHRGQPEYLEEVLEDSEAETGWDGNGEPGVDGEKDPLYDQAAAIVIESRRASISLIQRRLKIGYNRAANIMEAMEKAGIVSAMESNGTREVLVQSSVED